MARSVTYTDVVVQVVANRQVNPLIGRDQVRSVAGALDDGELVLGADTACKLLASMS